MLSIDPTEVYFADGPMAGKFMMVNTWPIKAVKAHELEVREFGKYDPDEHVMWEEVVYDKYITMNDLGSKLRIAYIGPRPRIKDLLMRD